LAKKKEILLSGGGRVNKIKVSIAIPAYNEIRFIRDTLNSVVNEADEIVIGDNASTDGTSDVIAEFAIKYKHIRHIKHKENIGSLKNMLFVVEESKGEYVRLVGAHDIISKCSTASMLKIFEENPDAGLVYSKLALNIDEDDNIKLRDINHFFSTKYNGNTLTRFLNYVVRGTFSIYYGLYNREYYTNILKEPKIMEFGLGEQHIISKILISKKAYACNNSVYYMRYRANENLSSKEASAR
jgi:glycosyltransferase involved in cell wall biosynthesis